MGLTKKKKISLSNASQSLGSSFVNSHFNFHAIAWMSSRRQMKPKLENIHTKNLA